jgi:hypothetical protein
MLAHVVKVANQGFTKDLPRIPVCGLDSVDLCSVFAMLFDPPSGISVNMELERGQSGENVHR